MCCKRVISKEVCKTYKKMKQNNMIGCSRPVFPLSEENVAMRGEDVEIDTSRKKKKTGPQKERPKNGQKSPEVRNKEGFSQIPALSVSSGKVLPKALGFRCGSRAMPHEESS